MLALYEMTVTSPEVLTKIAAKDPQLALTTSMSVSENPEITAPSSMPAPSSKPVPTKRIKQKKEQIKSQSEDKKIDMLLKKIESIENTLNEKNKENVPDFLKKLISQKNYIDHVGLVNNAV